MGLNTCWVAMTHGKSAAQIRSGEKETCLISIGYGQTQGVPHKSKDRASLVKVNGTAPDWFWTGMGFYTKMDLGIAKYHFKVASGKKVIA